MGESGRAEVDAGENRDGCWGEYGWVPEAGRAEMNGWVEPGGLGKQGWVSGGSGWVGGENTASLSNDTTTGDKKDQQQLFVKSGSQAVARRAVSWSSVQPCLLYTSPSPRDISGSRMPSSA